MIACHMSSEHFEEAKKIPIDTITKMIRLTEAAMLARSTMPEENFENVLYEANAEEIWGNSHLKGQPQHKHPTNSVWQRFSYFSWHTTCSSCMPCDFGGRIERNMKVEGTFPKTLPILITCIFRTVDQRHLNPTIPGLTRLAWIIHSFLMLVCGNSRDTKNDISHSLLSERRLINTMITIGFPYCSSTQADVNHDIGFRYVVRELLFGTFPSQFVTD